MLGYGDVLGVLGTSPSSRSHSPKVWQLAPRRSMTEVTAGNWNTVASNWDGSVRDPALVLALGMTGRRSPSSTVVLPELRFTLRT